MELIDLIKSRRTIHQFTSEAVAESVIQTALELAIWAPNHKLTFPWKFYDIGPETKAQIIDLAVELKIKKSGDEFTTAMQKSLRDKLSSASKMIFLGIKKSESAFQAREDYATLACGVQNMSLYLWSQKIGSKWSTAAFTSAPQTYKILGVRPEQVEIVGVLLIGHYRDPIRIPDRPKLQDHLQKTP